MFSGKQFRGGNIIIVSSLYSISLAVIAFTIVLLFKFVAYLSYRNISPSACSNFELMGGELYFPCDFTEKMVARHIVLNQLAIISCCRIFNCFFPLYPYIISFQIALSEQMAPHLYSVSCTLCISHYPASPIINLQS